MMMADQEVSPSFGFYPLLNGLRASFKGRQTARGSCYSGRRMQTLYDSVVHARCK